MTLKEKIKLVANILDELVDFGKIAKGIKNVILKTLMASIEAFDGMLFNLLLSAVIDKIPEKELPLIEAYLDAIIARDYNLAVKGSAEFINTILNIPGSTEDEELQAIQGNLVLMVNFAKHKFQKKIAA